MLPRGSLAVMCVAALALTAADSTAADSTAAETKLKALHDTHVALAGADALQLWRHATDLAAAAACAALRKEDPSMEVKLLGTDLDALRIWHGQSVTLGVEAEGQPYRYVVSSEEDWKRLADVLPVEQGGLLPSTDWEAVHRQWLSPVARGSLLPDFALQGPVDVFLSRPTALQLFLPHSSDAGVVRRVLLREGAAVLVRGARTVRLRRGLDLPSIGLSEFAGIVATDAAQQQPLGVLHLLAGVREAAALHWNSSHPDQSLGLVALELDLSTDGASLLAAATTAGGASKRLRVRRVKDGVIELLPRDSPASGPPAAAAAASAVAVPSAGFHDSVWPLASVHPAQLQAYERLLRQLIASRLFRASAAPQQQGQQQQLVRVAHDTQLRLLETEAQATTLLRMKLELQRRPKPKPASKLGGKAAAKGSLEGKQRQRPPEQQALTQQDGDSIAEAAVGEAPDASQVLAAAAERLGPFEEWTATVQVQGDAWRGNLEFVPLVLQRTGAAHDTFQYSRGALHSLFGSNVTQLEFE